MKMDNKKITKFIDDYTEFYKNNKLNIFERKQKNNLLLTEFVNRFSIANFKKINLENYYFEKGNKSTFSYWLDNRLNDLGNLHVIETCGFQKFHLQKIGNEIKFKRKGQINCWAGKTYKQVFRKVKSEILKLIQASIDGNYNVFRKTRIYSCTAAKISFLYNTKKFVPICSKPDSLNILKYFEIECSNKESLTDLRFKLYQVYLVIAKSINDFNTWDFMNFLYSSPEYRTYFKTIKTKSSKSTTQNSKNSKPKANNKNDYSDVQITYDALDSCEPFLDDELDQYEFVYNISKEQFKKEIGNIGEDIVINILEKKKKNHQIIDFIPECKLNHDNVHYDISYTDSYGEHFIDVKSTSRNLWPRIFFKLSYGERKKMINNLNNYEIYYIDDVLCNPTIHIFNGNDVLRNILPCDYYFKGRKK